MRIGFDIGSKNIHAVIMDQRLTLVEISTFEHNGNILKTFSQMLKDLFKKHNLSDLDTFGITGNIQFENIKVIDSILSIVEANKFLKVNAQNILSIGCESFYLILLDEKYNYVEHTQNSDCASGTGSFIDQQAKRLGFTTEDLAKKSYNYKAKSPSISTRCAVFAKSDIIHAQAQGFSKEAIAAGICEGVARSVLAYTVKGRELKGKFIIIGGVSKNKKIVSEISKILSKEVEIPENSDFFGAIGAAVLGEQNISLLKNLESEMAVHRELRDKLQIKLTDYPDFNEDTNYVEDDIEITLYQNIEERDYNLYLGIDIGSTSTKAIVLDEDKNIILGLYTRTAGDPIKAVHNLFIKLHSIFDRNNMNILGVGTTGSGRELVREVLNADLAINEISAHAKGATFLDPKVDTIIEIGGQDSKFTTLKNGTVVNSIMNYVCAAGTGSFIEEQAKRLNITLEQISKMALGQKAPYTSDRCTVYMERDLNIFLSEGWEKEQIIASVLFSVRDNYLSRVVGKTPLGNHIYFQGATAKNKALVAVFENEIEKPIFVSKYCHLTGALGSALYLIDKGINRSSFSGIDFEYTTSSEICTLCNNNCDLHIYEINGKKVAWGLKCGRDYEDKHYKKSDKLSFIEKEFINFHKTEFVNKSNIKVKNKIGIPLVLYMYEYYSLFKDMFERLGYEVIIEKSSPQKLHSGMSLINSDFCAPMIVTHGIVDALNNKDVDYIFMPTIINGQSYVKKLEAEEQYFNKVNDAYFCYYSEYAPTIVNNLTTINLKGKLISPLIKFNNTPIETVAKKFAGSIADRIDQSIDTIYEAFLKAYSHYIERKTNWLSVGKKVFLEDKKMKVMVLGRPYAIFDNQINQGILKKIEEMGFTIGYQSMIEYSYSKQNDKQDYLEKMHWFYGQQIMLASEYIIKNSNVYPIFLTCFRCSPDAYILNYFKKLMEEHNKPYLIIQLDEHSSDVGYQTRVEAGLETFVNDFDKKYERDTTIVRPEYNNHKISNDKIVLIPYISSLISNLQQYAYEEYGYKAIVLPVKQKTINIGYKFATGGECMPNVSIIGSVIETIKEQKLKPDKCILYLPTICMGCNFNQYTVLMNFAANNADLRGLQISNPIATKQLEELPKELNVAISTVNILSSILYKLYYRFKPYEIIHKSSDDALEKSLSVIKTCLNEHRSLMEAAKEIRNIFENVEITSERKPRIGILGDLYLKYNEHINDDVCNFIMENGGEVLMPSFTETIAHFLDADIRENGLNNKYLRGLVMFERRFENVFKDLIDDSFEPSVEECINLMYEFGIDHYIAGETTINVSRMLYYIKHKTVDMVVHINPILCCPGVVSSSIFRKIQKEFNTPIVDLFYDGTNKPNKAIIPHLYYLKNKKKPNK